MSVDAVQAAQRLLIHDLGELKRQVGRAMDAAQLGERPNFSDELAEAWSRVQRARLTVCQTMDDHAR